MLDIFLSYITFIPPAMLCLFPVKDKLKFSRLKTSAIVGGIIMLLIFLATFIEYKLNLEENDLLVPVFAILFLVYHFNLNVHISKSLAIFCASVALMSILANLTICIHSLVHVWLQSPNYRPESPLLQLFLNTAMTLLLAHPYLKYGSFIVEHVNIPRVWYTTIFISAAFYAINMVFLPLEYADSNTMLLIVCFIVVLLIMLILWLLLQVMFFFFVSDILYTRMVADRNRVLELQESQFAKQQRYMKATEKVRHDFRQSVQTLCELFDSGDYETAGHYIHQYANSVPVNDVTHFCSNTALNALLNFYAHTAAQNKINFKVRIVIPDVIPVSDVDLCNMIGNILENAIIACQKTENRNIQLTVLTENDSQLYIVAVNSFDGAVRMKDNRYLSTNRKGEGIGLSSISSTAEIYGGVAQFSHEGKQFFSNIAIPL